MILGGVEVPHAQGLDGHSDADVLAHAITDAVLGAAGLGDIGTHFPPSDDQWRDADSIELLRTSVAMVAGYVVNVDATVICEEPRLGEHRLEMERSPLRGCGRTRQRQGHLQRGHGLDRAWRGHRVFGCRLSGYRLTHSTSIPK